MNKMIALIKTTEERQIKGELHKNKLQEYADFISKKDKKQKQENIKTLCKIAILEKQNDKQTITRDVTAFSCMIYQKLK